MEVGRGLGGDGHGRGAAETGEEGCGLCDEGRLILLPAPTLRRKEGGVGFNEDARGWGVPGNLLQACAFRVREISREGQIETSGEGAFRLLLAARKAVHDTGKVRGGPVFGDQGEEVLPSVGVGEALLDFGPGQLRGAAVNGDGFAHAGGDPQLGEEGGFLDFGVGVVEVIVVQADLADGETAWMLGKFFELSQGFWSSPMGFLRMDAGGSEKLEAGRCVRLGEVECAMHGRGAIADADGENGRKPGLLRAVKHICETFVIVYVTM